MVQLGLCLAVSYSDSTFEGFVGVTMATACYCCLRSGYLAFIIDPVGLEGLYHPNSRSS